MKKHLLSIFAALLPLLAHADDLMVHFTFEDASSRVGEFTGKLYNNASFVR